MRYQLLRFFLFLLLLFFLVTAFFLWESFPKKPSFFESKEQRVVPHEYSLLQPGKIVSSLNTLSLQAFNEEITNLVAHTVPAVVNIVATDQPSNDLLLREFLGIADRSTSSPVKIGSGIIVSKEGHIITNLHVIRDAAQVLIELNDGRNFPAKLVGCDQQTDLAILEIHAERLTPIALGDSDQVEVGQFVLAIGNPFGLDETVTEGIISAKGRRTITEINHELFQTSALINPGNSGGPLVNIYGEVIGINNFIISRSGGAEGVAFAIPSNVARHVYNDIMQYGHTTHPWFGAVLKPLNQNLTRQLGLKNTAGALVTATLPGSPAEKAHLESGDVILTFNNQPIKDWINLRNLIAETKIGSTVSVGIQRKDRLLTLPVVIQAEPEH